MLEVGLPQQLSGPWAAWRVVWAHLSPLKKGGVTESDRPRCHKVGKAPNVRWSHQLLLALEAWTHRFSILSAGPGPMHTQVPGAEVGEKAERSSPQRREEEVVQG